MKFCIPARPISLPLSISFLAVLVYGLLSAQSACAAQPGSAGALDQVLAPSIGELTRSLMNLSAQYQSASAVERQDLLQQMTEVAITRRQLLMALVDDEPATVLASALPPGIRAQLPAAVQALAEEEVTTEGELEVMVEDHLKRAVLHHTLKNDRGQRLPLQFAGEPPDVQTGSRVRVHGIQMDNVLALGSGSTDVQVISAGLSNPFGAQSTVVILVNFQDLATQPYTVATAQNVVFTTTSNFYWEASYQQTWLTGTVVGWYTIPMSSTVCDPSTLATYAKSAATAAGVNLAGYTHYVYAFPQNACTFSGQGTVGGNPSQAWINGNLQFMLVGHELGHNLGLYHSHALDCGSAVIGSSCTAVEYGDDMDVMGGYSPAHFNAFQKERLGWLNAGTSPPITTVQANGTYLLDPYETVGPNPKALKILKSIDPTTGAQTYYYVEYRQAAGFDNLFASQSYPQQSNIVSGVMVHTATLSDSNSSELLDMNPPAILPWPQPALDVGQTFFDPTAGVGLSVAAATSSGASVEVTLNGTPPPTIAPTPTPTCAPANPGIAISPGNQTTFPGLTVSYQVSVTSNDSASCGPSTFTLQAGVPTGWTSSLASSSVSLSPGASTSTMLYVTSPASAAGGAYPVGMSAAKATSSTFAASASATYVVFLSTSAATATPTSTVLAAPTSTPTLAPTLAATSTPTSLPSRTATATWTAVSVSTPGATPTVTMAPAFTPTATPAALLVTVATDQGSYTRAQTVSITAAVSAGALPVSGAAVTFTVTKSNGVVVTQNATTASNGTATYQLRLKKQDPTGTYQVRVSATANRMSATASTSFTVR